MDLREYRIKNEDNFIRHPWEIAKSNIVKKILLRYYLKKTANILDIGTGDGFYLGQIYNLFEQAKGIGFDINLSPKEEKNLNTAFKKLNITFTSQQSTAIDFCKENKIDIICLMDVLEHIKDDSSFLSNILKEYNLDADSYFIITVPAFNKIFSNHDKNMKHYRRYTKKTLITLLQQNNLEILEMGYFFSSLLFLRMLTFFKEKMVKSNKKTKNPINWSYGKFLARITKNILMSDFYFNQFLKKLNIDLPGLSIYAIVKVRK